MQMPPYPKLKLNNLKYVLLFVFCYLGVSWTYFKNQYFMPKENRVNNLDFEYAITPRSICSRKFNPDLLVMVLSTPAGAKKRQAIRETWGSVSRHQTWPNQKLVSSVKFIFLVGISIKADDNDKVKTESVTHGDILSIHMEDVYGLQVTKKILMGFKWAGLNCQKTKHIMKVDDDTFVDLPTVMEKLKSPKWSSSICGHKILFPMAKRLGKYYLSYEEYPFSMLPSYIFGYFYVMPLHVAVDCVAMSQYVPYLRMEDVYITGVLPRVLGVSVKGFFTVFLDRYYDVDQCDFVSGKFDANVLDSTALMYAVWDTYMQPGICHLPEARYIISAKLRNNTLPTLVI